MPITAEPKANTLLQQAGVKPHQPAFHCRWAHPYFESSGSLTFLRNRHSDHRFSDVRKLFISRMTCASLETKT
jgi:hypothetical protein